MSEAGDTAAGGDRAEEIERVLRALRISGRRLVRCKAGWRVIEGGDRRRRARLMLAPDEVERLARERTIVAAGEDMYMLGGVDADPPPMLAPWAYVAAGMQKRSRDGGLGFGRLALRARRGEGPLTMRHVQAGLKLLADAECTNNSSRVTMDWDAGPVDRQRRGGNAGGMRGLAMDASRRLRRARMLTGTRPWEIAWALCVEGMPLRTIRQRFGLGARDAGARMADALEAVATAYER